MERERFNLAAGLSLTTLLCAAAWGAEWTVINLHPGPGGSSISQSVCNGQQAGVVTLAGSTTLHASLWRGSSGSWIDLNPSVSFQNSIAYATDEGQQVGFACPTGIKHAGVWSGSADSWIDLHPTGFDYSEAYALHAGQQVGYVSSGSTRASMWSGSAATWIDLHPAGALHSSATAVHSGRQGGIAQFGSRYHAGLWSGSASSWLDLNPANVYHGMVRSMDSAQQVGSFEYLSPSGDRACLWTGTPESFVDLHPAGASASIAFAVFGGVQAGFAVIGGMDHACLWTGTASSWVDLHPLLPPTFTSSVARGVWSNAKFTYVTGSGFNAQSGHDEAILWVKLPPCGADLNADTIVNEEDFSMFAGQYDILDCADSAMPADCPADLNGDNVVDDADFQVFVVAYNQFRCP